MFESVEQHARAGYELASRDAAAGFPGAEAQMAICNALISLAIGLHNEIQGVHQRVDLVSEKLVLMQGELESSIRIHGS